MTDAGKTTASRANWLQDADKPSARTVLALVVAWSQAEPARIGEAILLHERDGDRLFGRGAPRADDALPRVSLGRSRPSGFEPRGPIDGPRISRGQLRLRAEHGGIRFERLGRCPVLLRGAPVDKGIVAPGDSLLLEDEMLLHCVERPEPMPGAGADQGFGFGECDAHGLVGESAAAWALRAELAFMARAGGHVLVLGPSGVGKELGALALHTGSARAAGPFVARNAATLPAGLVDAELFGTAKNYPSAPMPERPGLLGEASGGTLFLDEVGELPHELQAHLLRVLDSNGEYHRLGEAQTRRADVRIVAATNRDEDSLKLDFAARFSLRVRLPGLDARREDVPLLVRHLLRHAAATDASLLPRFFDSKAGSPPEPRVDPRLILRLIQHDFSRHVRELETILWEAMAKSPGGHVALPRELEERLSEPLTQPEELTKERIEAALEAHAGNQERAYRQLGLKNRDVLYRLLKKHGIQIRRS